ncbi:PspA/IM30 family protein [Fuerstiella marisgermanici]|uniref:Phage shock protein A (PspA) family protein n=1 Tax=Fuerstiella marisgermanici TaxID=1891926 RepID=A0A1P8WFX8_9PLAN|nr:PspA/IM30 family protein [Fuerstiella marisgermanici]APZ92971.1 hypothetical protein Fuma_02583 [Fuerstiella marisgermanici]
MGLFKRISDIISANLNEMVEQHEDPEKMLKQAIREMKESIKAAELDTARVLANEKKLKRELVNNESDVKRWTAEAESAVDVGNDDLARKALSRKLAHGNIVQALRDQLEVAEPATQTLRHQLEGMNAKLAEATRNLATLSARKQAAEVRKKALSSMSAGCDPTVGDAAFEKFDRMREKVEQAEAEADALAELRGDTCLPNATSNKVDAELEALKLHRKAGQ